MSIRTILVDDDDDVRTVLKELLESEPDIRIIGEAENGRTAVALASERAPNVMILDINMPVMNGIRATREITRANGSIYVLGMSMHDAIDRVRRMVGAGARGYLRKDTAAEELAHAIRAVSQGNRYVGP